MSVDLRRSREFLEDLLNGPVPFLAYPRGLHDEGVRRAARRAGYSHGFALPEGPERVDEYAVPRVGIHRGNGTRTLAVKSQAAVPRRPSLPSRTQLWVIGPRAAPPSCVP